MTGETLSIVLGVATRARPKDLARCLSGIAEQQFAGRLHVIVADNDPHAPLGVECLAPLGRLGADAIYIQAPTPGIPATRNLIVETWRARWPEARWLVFTDDDAWPGAPSWLDHLIGAGERTGADIVCGPQLYVALGPEPAWLEHASSMLDHATRPAGPIGYGVSTGNVALASRLFAAVPLPWFDARYTRSGGSDVAFFMRAARAGAKAYFEPKARVMEACGADRLTLAWWRKRMSRNGAVHARVLLRDRGLLGFLSESALDVPRRLAAIGWRLVRPRKRGRLVGAVLRASWLSGYLKGALGLLPNWYAPPPVRAGRARPAAGAP